MKSFLINLIFSAVIVILGSWSYVINRDVVGLYIAIAYALFGLSHIIWFFGREKVSESGNDIIRILGYLCILIALFISVIYK